jgi:hypothetical protein
MTFCTIKAKETLLEEFRQIADDKQPDFIKQKQAERDAITMVSSSPNAIDEVRLILTRIKTACQNM